MNRSERGLVTTELAILFPLVIAVVLVALQLTLWAHARAVAQGAAEHGAEVAAAFDGSSEDGQRAAEDYLALAGQVDEASVRAERGPDSATVTVVGTYPSLFGRLTISATTSVPIERLVR
ncbi:MAG: TadE family protein [Actinomycetota bacterium]